MKESMQRYAEYKKVFDESLILNPTENIPWKSQQDISFLEGLYIFEDAQEKDEGVFFGGRQALNNGCGNIFSEWNSFLRAKVSSFKPNSGLDAHILLFMSLADIGDRILYLSELGGGHSSAHGIIKRLGLNIKGVPIDCKQQCVDIPSTKALIEEWHPSFIFIDRSNGLNYEDFSWLQEYNEIIKVFDASQYLVHIMAEDYNSPFDMGFNIVISTLHKNYPGPQKAAIFSNENDEIWRQIDHGLRSYVSNCHPKDIFNALLTLPSKEVLKQYSKSILSNALSLQSWLYKRGINVVERKVGVLPTQHIWICFDAKNEAFAAYKRLETAGFLVNYKALPYELGYGLRLGTAGATRQGLIPDDTKDLSELIAQCIQSSTIGAGLIDRAASFIRMVRSR